MLKGDRRLEAENYLSAGYGIRLAIEGRAEGWAKLRNLASVALPSRLKGIHVGPRIGKPYLGATQVFDLRPTARRWLTLDSADQLAELTIKRGTILVTRSGSVGRSLVAPAQLEEFIVSDDLLRVNASPGWWGWLYAYLHTKQVRGMMRAAHYGHIIKHLEVPHLTDLPVLRVSESARRRFDAQVRKIVEDRERSLTLVAEAEHVFQSAFPSLRTGTAAARGPLGFEISSRRIVASLGSRLDASRYVPAVDETLKVFRRDAKDLVPLAQLALRVFVPGRFKHVYGQGGTPYLDSADILEVNPDIKKYVLSLSPEEQDEYRVEPGWILIPCSGQVYGNIGHSVMATEWHCGKVLTNHILRVCPNDIIRPGYLVCALGHPDLGRPQLVRFAFGSSVPEIAPEDVATALVPRLSNAVEGQIADLMEEASKARNRADELEVRIATEAGNLVDEFLAGQFANFEVSGSAH